MRVFRTNYRDRQNRIRQARKWYVELRFADETVRRVPAFTDRGASVEYGRMLERLVALQVAQAPMEAALVRWIQGLGAKERERLARIGLIDRSFAVGPRTIEELLTEFDSTLRARERTRKHVSHVVGRVRRLFASCGFAVWKDIDGRKLELHLRARREAGLSAKTSNHFLASAKQFTKWCMTSGLSLEDPLARVPPVNARLDPRRVRRSLSI